jgi:uncharacterized protein YqcC (DUF446 family)
MENQSPTLHELVIAKAAEIEDELKRLNRWQADPLPEERFENMGAFGSNTMAFEQWIQFILIPRIQQIVRDKDEFPSGSMLATYAVRAFDGDYDTTQLQNLLYDLDQLINTTDESLSSPPEEHELPVRSDTVSIGDTTIPPVLYTLAELLPQFENDDLESQLQTFDTFLGILAPSARTAIRDLLQNAAEQSPHPASKLRLENAAKSVGSGGQAALWL